MGVNLANCRALFILTVLLVLLPVGAYSAYVSDLPTTLTQPDGTVIKCFASGDEYYNWAHDRDGYVIIRNPSNGYWVYAVLVDGQVVASRQVVGRVNPAKAGFTPNIRPNPARIEALRTARSAAPLGINPQPAPTAGTINSLVIFIRFSDEVELTDPVSVYESTYNSTAAGASSMTNYFLEASYNALNIHTTFYPTPTGPTVISYQDSHPRAYYEPYDATTNPTGYQDSERKAKEQQLLADAINAVKSQIPVDLDLDSNGDGNVDGISFVVNGSATPWSSLLWPHKWSLTAQTVQINGKTVYDYNFLLNTWIVPDENGVVLRGLGTICHEFIHTLGAPDLYHYTSTTAEKPVGWWDIMGQDCNPPQHPGAYLKYKYLHWIPSLPQISAYGTYTLNPLTSPTDNCFKIPSPNSPYECFVVEYRRKTGTFESSLPDSGMLIYRINSQYSGNSYGPPDEVYVFRPWNSDWYASQACFSTESGRTAFADDTNPACLLGGGIPGGIYIWDVGSAGETISFKYVCKLPTPTTSKPSGTYPGPTKVTLTCPLGISEIHYTLDGSTPDINDPFVVSGGTVTLSQSATLKVRSFNPNYYPSDVVSATYTLISMSISGAKLRGDGTQVGIHAGVVTAVFGCTSFYVEAADRVAGILVKTSGHDLTVGMCADVVGTMATDTTSGERYLSASYFEHEGYGSAKPLFINPRWIGGTDWFYNSSNGAGQLGFPGATGLNNVGLLVRTAGKVTRKTASTITIKQGDVPEVTCALPSSVTADTAWDYAYVNGVVSRYVSGTATYPRIRLRDSSDIHLASGACVYGNITSSTPGIYSRMFESQHPYAANASQNWILTSAAHGTQKMRVHFTKLELESGADSLQLIDGKGNVVQRFDNSSAMTDFWSGWLTGSYVQLHLQTNWGVNRYGFQMDKYEARYASGPRSGVTVTLSPDGLTAKTDSFGNYAFHHISAGDYTITPSAAGATFDPASGALTLEGNEVIPGVDFMWR